MYRNGKLVYKLSGKGQRHAQRRGGLRGRNGRPVKPSHLPVISLVYQKQQHLCLTLAILTVSPSNMARTLFMSIGYALRGIESLKNSKVPRVE